MTRKTTRTPQYMLRRSVKVGIYDGEYVIRVYADLITVVIPYVRWVGNTGGYAESRESIRDEATIRAVLQEMRDDCEDSALGIIGRQLQDPYLSTQGSGEI